MPSSFPSPAAPGRKSRATPAYVARDVNTLYGLAKESLDRRDYERSAQLFDEVERQHPYSVWARRAQLMSAFSYYMAQKYPEAVSSAQRFLTIHPGNKDAPYASYLIAMSYYEQIEDVARDQKITQQASDALNELIRRYPHSRYAADARLKIDLVNDHLAGKEMEVGRFYQRSGKWLAAAIRFRDVVDKYQTTSHTPEALSGWSKPISRSACRTRRAKAAAVLGANYPGSEWYAPRYKLIQRNAPQG